MLDAADEFPSAYRDVGGQHCVVRCACKSPSTLSTTYLCAVTTAIKSEEM